MTDEKKSKAAAAADDQSGPGVASPEQNAALEHPAGGATTRDDNLDAGVPMIQGSPTEPVGPEDALGRGDKRGDYRERVPGDPHTSQPIADGGQPIYRNSKTGNICSPGDNDAVLTDYSPRSELVAQKPHTEDIGDAAGVKGGVGTDPASPEGRAFAAGQAASSASS